MSLRDVVISVPVCFTKAELLIIKKAAEIAKLNLLQMSVVRVGFDRSLGGLEVTMRLRDLLVEKFRQHYKSQKDITTSESSMAKLFKEAERLKQVLSANLDYCAQVKSVHEDIDMRMHVTRDEFN
ncbi:hypothetical protein TELCIR_11687 [Teladorsagia circumcincta]|uniref:Hypoxia up-regulated protein 1 n=1 Tax=Teladorsagia circumcincta TaxID=45464 RepID=A0A2G9U8J4_TELCI|nr:hypothetical protein TELCIR_11687 [Teladorsagia circumcincta]